MNPKAILSSSGLEPGLATLTFVLWGYTLFYWIKPYLPRIFCRFIWFCVQLLSFGLFLYSLRQVCATVLQDLWNSVSHPVSSLFLNLNGVTFQSADGSVMWLYLVVSFLFNGLALGVIWHRTQPYGGLAGKSRALNSEDSAVNSVTLKDLTALITTTLQPFKSQPPTTTTSTSFDISTITQQLILQLKPLIVEAINQALVEIPALSSLVTSVPSANFVANLVEGVQVEIENLDDSVKDLRHLLIASANKISTPSSLSPQPKLTVASESSSTNSNLCNPELNSEKHVRWADIVSSDEEEPHVKSMVAMTPKSFSKVKKAAPSTPRRVNLEKSASLELPEEFLMLTEDQLLEKLKERQLQRQAERRAPYYLTDAEKQLSMDALHRAWKLERQRQNNEREALSKSDFEELGQLTAEQKELPRAAVRRIIRQRKNEVWANAMKARGIPVFQCDVCYELTTGNHRCLATKWTTDNSKNSAVSKGIVMTQGPSGIRLQTKSIIDQEKLNKEYEQLKALREELEAKAKLVQPLKSITQDTTMSHTSTAPLLAPDPPLV